MNFHNTAAMSQHYKYFKEDKKKKRSSSSSSSSYKSDISKVSKKSMNSVRSDDEYKTAKNCSSKQHQKCSSSDSSPSYQNKKYFDLKKVKSYSELERQNSKTKIKEDLRNPDSVKYEKKENKRISSKSISSSSSIESEPVYIQKESNYSQIDCFKSNQSSYDPFSHSEEKKIFCNKRNSYQSNKDTKDECNEIYNRRTISNKNNSDDNNKIEEALNTISERDIPLKTSEKRDFHYDGSYNEHKVRSINEEEISNLSQDKEKIKTDKFNSEDTCPDSINRNNLNNNANTLSMRRKPISNFSDSPPVNIVEKIESKRVSHFSTTPKEFSSLKFSYNSDNMVQINRGISNSASNIINPNLKLKIINESGKKKIILNKNRKISDILIVKRDGNQNK